MIDLYLPGVVTGPVAPPELVDVNADVVTVVGTKIEFKG